MAKTLAEKIKESRQISVKVGDVTFTARRATVEEMYRYAHEMTSDAEIARRHTLNWDGVKESDLIEDGSADLVPFDKSIFDDVIGDNREWWTFISNAVTSKALERINQKADSKKK